MGQESFSTNPAVRLYRYDTNTGEVSEVVATMLTKSQSISYKIKKPLELDKILLTLILLVNIARAYKAICIVREVLCRLSPRSAPFLSADPGDPPQIRARAVCKSHFVGGTAHSTLD